MTLLTEEEAYELRLDEPPSSVFRKDFADFVRETSRPEDFPGISRRAPPDGLNGGIKVCPISVDGTKRDGQRVPCAICQRPKFLHGALFWFRQDKCIRLLGNCCASDLDAAGARQADEAFNVQIQAEKDCDFLEKNLKFAPAISAELRKLEEVSETIMVYRSEFKLLRAVNTELRKALKIGGKLNITVPLERSNVRELLKTESGSRDGDNIIKTVHVLEGREFLDTKFNPHYLCQSLLTFFSKILQPDERAYEAMLLDLVDNDHKIIKFTRDYTKAVSDIRRLHQFLTNAVKFFSASNLAGLKEFGSNRDTHLPFSVIFNDAEVIFKHCDTRTPCIFKRGVALLVPSLHLPF